MISFGEVPASSVLPIFFDSYAGATGASITLTGLAITDVEIYKGTSMTQRASDAGVVLIDTDGIDLDGVTGIHGFSIDLSDNTDASFYAVGSFFTVVVSAVTIDSQTVNFVAATFRIKAAEAIAGHAKVDVGGWLGTAPATPTVNGVPEVDVTHVAGATTDVSALATNVAAILVDTGTTLDGRIPAALVSGRIDASVGAMAANVMTAAAAAADLTTELQSGLATAAALATVDGIVDDILLDTAEIGAAGAGLTALATQASVDTIDNFLDTEIAGIITTLGVAGAGLTAVVWNAAWDAEVQSEVADALAVYDPPTNAEMEARTIAAATYATATNLATANTNISAIITTVGVAGAGLTAVVWNAAWDAEVQSEAADALIATSLTESYRAVAAAGTLPQLAYEMLGLLGEKAVAGVTLTTKKVDQVTTAATYTLDDAVNATSITRAT